MLGRAVRELRRGLGLTQEELAELSGMDRAYEGAIERGERRPTYGKVLDLAQALGVSGAELVARAAAHGAEDGALSRTPARRRSRPGPGGGPPGPASDGGA